MTPIRKVLLVEDQEHDQFIATRNIKRCWPSATILIAGDGEAAIDLLHSMPEELPDLILLDINMPRMNGHEFLETWSKVHGRDIPVVVMLTSSNEAGDREKSGSYRFVRHFVMKPLDKSTIENLSEKLGMGAASH